MLTIYANELTYVLSVLQQDFSKKPLNTAEEVNDWLKFYEMSAPLTCIGHLVSHDPVSVGLVCVHTHTHTHTHVCTHTHTHTHTHTNMDGSTSYAFIFS